MNPSSNSKPSTQELLERGRLKLRAIEIQERIAIYQAASASLKAAMIQAENGDAETLRLWLEQESAQLHGEIGIVVPMDGEMAGSKSVKPAQSIRIDPAHAFAQTNRASVSSSHASNIESPWEVMERSAQERIKNIKLEALVERNAGLEINEADINEAKAETDSLKSTDSSVVDPFELIQSEPTEKAVVPTETLEGTLLSENEEATSAALHQITESLRHNEDPTQSRFWWLAPHVWGSFVAHALLVAAMSFFAIHLKSATEPLSIVSATVEAENVLLETPMETISELSELEVTTQESFDVQTPSLSNMINDVSVPSTSIQTEFGSGAPQAPSVAAAVAGSASEVNSPIGSKMLSGAEFFGVKATGNTFVYIVDSSPSMRRDDAFDAARKEILRSLSSMKPKQRYFVSFFGKEIDPMVLESGVVERYPVYANPENLTKTITWLKQVEVQKLGWPPTDALAEAISMQPDGIFLLFDGETKVDVAKQLRRINRSDDLLSRGMPKVPIHVIHFFQDEFQKQMRQIAEENAGTYRFVPRPDRTSKSSR